MLRPDTVSLLASTPGGGTELQLGPLLMGLFGGLALFLYGMDKMSDALKAVAGERMRTILARLTSHRVMAAATGAFITATIQSSSVTTVMVVGFITAGLLSLSQSVGIIMGANVGTTITAQIIAFKITKFAHLLIAAGFGMTMIGRHERSRQYGALAMGLGLIFFGMAIMGEAMHPIRTHEPFLDLMTRMASPAIGIACGALFTALVQSSSATTGIVIVMASEGLITLPAGIAIIFGANIGTCVTAVLSSLGKPREALRAALVHVLFNVLGVAMWLPFIGYLSGWVAILSPASPELTGTARLAAETPRQIANAHSVFNVVNTAVLLGFSTQFARLVERLVPDRPIAEEAVVRARYLDSELLNTPALALDRVRLETARLGERIRGMMQEILPALLSGEREALDAVAKRDDEIDALHGQTVLYLGKISRSALTDDQTQEFLRLLETVNALESIGDLIETNLVGTGRRRIEHQVTISHGTKEVIATFHDAVQRALDLAVQAVTQEDADAARSVVQMKAEINDLARAAAIHEGRRLAADEPNRLPTYNLEIDALQSLKRIYYFAKRMARASLPPARKEGHGV